MRLTSKAREPEIRELIEIIEGILSHPRYVLERALARLLRLEDRRRYRMN